MNIKKRLHELLMEAKHKSHKHNYGCLMIDLKIAKKEWNDIIDKIDNADIYQPKEDPTYGKESEPHITILYGLEETVSVKEIKNILNNVDKPEVKIAKISLFKNNNDFDVLKYDIESDELHKLNKMVKKLPHVDLHPTYKPHCTIAYLKKGLGEKYIKILKSTITLNITPMHFIYSTPKEKKHIINFQ